MTEDEADTIAKEALLHLFRPDRIASVIRRPAPIFGGERALDWIREGRLAEVVKGYTKALTYQG